MVVIAAAAVRDVELYGDNKEAGEEGEKSSYPEDVSLLLEQWYHCLSTRVRGGMTIHGSEYKWQGQKINLVTRIHR